jgi:hypothetical protein
MPVTCTIPNYLHDQTFLHPINLSAALSISSIPPETTFSISSFHYQTTTFLKRERLQFSMGKTGTTTWIRIKGRKGQVRLVPGKWQHYKPTGPNQKYDSRGKRRRRLRRSQKSILGVRS